MGTGGLPDRAELREVVSYLRAGLDGRWTVRDWSAWSGRAFAWCYTTTRGLLRALARVEELEAEAALLRAELDQLRAQRVPVAPTIVPPMRRATPPPPPRPSSASAALRAPAQRPPTDLEAEVLRRVQERLPEMIADEWREVSAVDLEVEEAVWSTDGETVYEDPER